PWRRARAFSSSLRGRDPLRAARAVERPVQRIRRSWTEFGARSARVASSSWVENTEGTDNLSSKCLTNCTILRRAVWFHRLLGGEDADPEPPIRRFDARPHRRFAAAAQPYGGRACRGARRHR